MVSLVLSEFASMVVNSIREILPQFVVNGLPRIFPRGFLELRSKNGVRFVSARKTDQTQAGWQITVHGKIVESRNKFSVRQISSGAKNHDRTRLRHGATRQALEQWINRHFVGHSSRFRSKAVTRTYVSTPAGVNTVVRLYQQAAHVRPRTRCFFVGESTGRRSVHALFKKKIPSRANFCQSLTLFDFRTPATGGVAPFSPVWHCHDNSERKMFKKNLNISRQRPDLSAKARVVLH